MKLRLLNVIREVSTNDLEETISPHTGNSLQQVEFSVTIPPESAAEFSAELEDAKRPEGAISDESGGAWRVLAHSHSYTNDGPRRFKVELVQAENLQATRLDFSGLSLEPLYYEETAKAGESLMVIAEIHPKGEDAERLETLISRQSLTNEYFDVRRVGVADRHVAMRWGRCLWQEVPGGGRRHLIVFIGQKGDEENRRPQLLQINQPDLDNTSRIAIGSQEFGDALLEELERAGVLNLEAATRIRQRVDEAWERRYRELDQTRDIAQYR